MINFRVVGLKGVQPRAADTTATVCAFLLSSFFLFLFRSSYVIIFSLVAFLIGAFDIYIFFHAFLTKRILLTWYPWMDFIIAKLFTKDQCVNNHKVGETIV